MKKLTPLDMAIYLRMIDAATGYRPVIDPVERDTGREAEIMLRLADAAKAWYLLEGTSNTADRVNAKNELMRATQKWIDIGG